MKRFLSLFLSVLLLLVPCATYVFADALAPDTSWYDAQKAEFTLTTPAQLLGFSQLGQSNTFEGKTVKLGADITLNEGDSAAWATQAPATVWTPVSNFAGTFDGQGYTVSGLYVKNGGSAAMFRSATEAALIADFRLVNSYFESTGDTAAGVCASGAGTLFAIYSNATVVCKGHHAGGLFGVGTAGKVVVDACWFDGSVTLGMRYGAGIVGNGNNQRVEIVDCLNSGTVHSSCETTTTSHIGGIIGRNDKYTDISNCLNVGKITTFNLTQGNSDVIGAIAGACTNKGTGIALNVTNCWASIESCATLIGANSASAASTVENNGQLPDELLKGYDAYYNTTLDFQNAWAVQEGSYPIPQYFAEVIPPIYDVNAPAVSDYEVKSEGHYGPRWTVELTLPENVTKEQVTLGLLLCPTKAIPADEKLNLNAASYDYRGNTYEVANVTAEIFRESEEGKLVATFVITDIGIETARTNFTVRPYAIYQMKEGALNVYGNSASATFFTDAALLERAEDTDATVKEALSSVLAPIYEALGKDYPVSGDWSTLDLFDEVPAMIVEDAEISVARDHGVGNYVITVDGTNDPDYHAYLALLEAKGFEKVYDNGEKGLNDSVYTTTFQKDDLVLTVTHVSYINETYVSACFDLPLSEHLYDNFSKDVIEGASTKLYMLEIKTLGNSFIIKLKNGHFIISDGGQESEFEHLMSLLTELADDKDEIIVDAWMVTHLHNDHFHVMNGFNKNPEWAEKIRVEGFYFHEPSDEVKDMDPGVYGEIANEYKAMALLKTTKGETPKVYRPQTGQIYYFSDISVEILMAPEQILPEEHANSFNDTSLFYLFRIDGQTFLNAGDASKANMQFIMDAYDPEYLELDFFQVLHHGGNTWTPFTDFITCTTALLPTTATTIDLNPSTANGYLLSTVEEYYLAGNGTCEFTFPYKVGEAVTFPRVF